LYVGRLIFEVSQRELLWPPFAVVSSKYDARYVASPRKRSACHPELHGGILGIGEQFIGACLRQIVRRAFDEVICRNMIGYVEEITPVAGHGRYFWRGVPSTSGTVFRNAIRDCLCKRRS